MPALLHIEQFDQFSAVKDFPAPDVSPHLLRAVRSLDERTELEPAFLSALADPNVTPHGPAEIVDILTHRLTISGQQGLAAFILKGKSFPTVRPKDISHQVYRLRKIDGLRFAILAVTGNLLDQAKEEFVSTARSTGSDYAIFDANDISRLLVISGSLCPRDGRQLVAGRCQCGYRPKIRELNNLQEAALRGLTEARRLGQDAGVVVMPTGSGKTLVAAMDARATDAKSVLYVAHTHEILDVAEADFASVIGIANVRRVKHATDLHGKEIVKIGTIQYLSRHLEAVAGLAPNYLVIDEFHRAAAESYRRLIDVAEPQFLLGLTATPFRSDRQDVVDLCGGNVIVNFELRMGIDCGILVPYHYHGCFDDVDYSRLWRSGGKYSVRDLEKALVIPERDMAIIDKWRQLADGRPTLAFCCSQNHARRMTDGFRAAGISADCYLSDTTIDERKLLIHQLQQGDVRILCTVDVLNEGADFPFVECLLFLRPTESKRVFFQQLGRGLRRAPGKFVVTVIDFIGNFHNAYRIVEYHGLLPVRHEGEIHARPSMSAKQILNLPIGCSVTFDDRVIDIFERQFEDPRRITRHNISRVLIYRYMRLCKRMRRRCTRDDLRRYELLYSLYPLVFGRWNTFFAIMKEDPDLNAYLQSES